MKKHMNVLAVVGASLALGGAAHGTYYEINLSGFTLIPTQHQENHVVAAPGETVTMIEWNLVYEAGSAVGTASWGSELSIDLAAPGHNLNAVVPTANGGFYPATPGDPGTFIWGSPDPWSGAFAPGSDPNSHNLGWPDSASGIHTSSGSTNALNGLPADGTWQLGIYDSFDDFGGQGMFHPDSWIRIHFTKLPAPGAFALLGIAGLVGTRRRRD